MRRHSICQTLLGLLFSVSIPLSLPLLSTPLSAQPVQERNLLAGERAAQVPTIPGVVAASANWQLVWADFVTADGIVGTRDGGVLFAQEQSDKIIKLLPDGSEYTYLNDIDGPGAVSLDTENRLFAAQRSCTEPLSSDLAGCNALPSIVMLAPYYRMLANSFPDGRPLGRVNDLITDGDRGVYFTSGGAWYINPEGDITTVVDDDDVLTNGIMLNRDGSVLYVTNNDEVLAFDVNSDGTTDNRRVFTSLNDTGGDGMAIDEEGRLYVTANEGIHVISEQGEHLGIIPTPRRAITLAFSGPDKLTLYVPMMGAVGPDGKAWNTPEGVRNTAMSIYTLDMETPGIMSRPK